MFCEGQFAVVDSEGTPNHGCAVRIVASPGYNCREDKFDPEWRDAVLLDGPNVGKIGSLPVSNLKVLLNG